MNHLCYQKHHSSSWLQNPARCAFLLLFPTHLLILFWCTIYFDMTHCLRCCDWVWCYNTNGFPCSNDNRVGLHLIVLRTQKVFKRSIFRLVSQEVVIWDGPNYPLLICVRVKWSKGSGVITILKKDFSSSGLFIYIFK